MIVRNWKLLAKNKMEVSLLKKTSECDDEW